MNCPILLILYGQKNELPNMTPECDKEKCAWWFGAQGCCSITAIANSLEAKQ